MSNINPFHVLSTLGVNDCISATPVNGGWSTHLWKVDCPDGPAALRLSQPGWVRAAAIEAETMRQVANTGIPVPQVLAEGIWEDRSALLLSWCEGRTLMQEMRARPWAIRRLGYQFGQQQAALHATRHPAVETCARTWIIRFGPVDTELHERLLSCEPLNDRTLHLDYHPLNVMVSRRQISGILDWENAIPGEPRADVARTWSILRLMPLTPNRPEPVTEAARRLLTAGWLRGYEDIAGPLRDMPLFKAWAGEAMIQDLRDKIGQPAVWIEQRHVNTIQGRVNQLRREAGLAARRIA